MPRRKRGPRSEGAEERRATRRLGPEDSAVAESLGAEARPSLGLGAEARPPPGEGNSGCGNAPVVPRLRLPWGPCTDPPPGWRVRLVEGAEVLEEVEEAAASAPLPGPPA